MARDEGYYMLAAKLVMQGELPYLDFFYPQMPLLPYIYGVWLDAIGWNWFSARVFTALLCCLSILGVYTSTRRLFNQSAAVVAIALFAGSCLTFQWLVSAQAYALTTLLALLAYCCLVELEHRNKLVLALAAGAFIGLAACTRLYLIVLMAPAFLWIALRIKTNRKQLLGVLTIGCCLALLPAVYLFIQDPYNFYFNNLGYHVIRTDLPFPRNYWNKWVVAKIIMGLRETDKFSGYQSALLFWGTLIYVVMRYIGRNKTILATWFGLTLFLVSLVPTPTYVQYFSIVIPFFAICSVGLCIELLKRAKSNASKTAQVLVYLLYVLLTFVFLHPITANVEQYTSENIGVPGIGPNRTAEEWELKNIQAVNDFLADVSTPGERVIAQWPGYLLGAKARIFSGLENQFGVRAAKNLEKSGRAESAQLRKRLKILLRKEIKEAISAGKAEYVVLRAAEARRFFKKDLQNANYQVIGRLGSIQVFRQQG